MNHNYSKLILDGDEAYDKEEWQKAINLYCQAAKNGDANGLARLGFYYLFIEGNSDLAKKYFDEAIESGSIVAYKYMTYYYEEINHMNNVLLYREKYAALGDVLYQAALGVDYCDGELVTKDFTKAIYWLEKAISNFNQMTQIKPEEIWWFWASWYAFGNIHFQTNQFYKAIECYNNAINIFLEKEALFRSSKDIDINERLAEIYVDLGASYYNIGKANEALENFSRAVQLDPNNKEYQHRCHIVRECMEKAKLDDVYCSLDELLEHIDDYDVKCRFKANARKRGNCACPMCGEVREVYSWKVRDLVPPIGGFLASCAEMFFGYGRKFDVLEEWKYLCSKRICRHNWEN